MTELGPVELPPLSGPVKGFVSTAPTGLGQTMQVIVPSFSAEHSYEVRRWSARGLTVPAVGDEVLLIEDENGIPWVVSWWPAAGDAGLIGTLSHPHNFGVVTALPTKEPAPARGDTCSFEAAAGIFWDLVYTGEATYPWAATGPPMRAEVEAGQGTASTTYTDLATVGPSLTTPLAGLYIITVGALMWNNAAGGESYMVPSINGVASGSAYYARTNNSAPTTVNNHLPPTAVEKGKIVKSVYKSTGGNTLNVQSRWIEIVPTRVG